MGENRELRAMPMFANTLTPVPAGFCSDSSPLSSISTGCGWKMEAVGQLWMNFFVMRIDSGADGCATTIPCFIHSVSTKMFE